MNTQEKLNVASCLSQALEAWVTSLHKERIAELEELPPVLRVGPTLEPDFRGALDPAKWDEPGEEDAQDHDEFVSRADSSVYLPIEADGEVVGYMLGVDEKLDTDRPPPSNKPERFDGGNCLRSLDEDTDPPSADAGDQLQTDILNALSEPSDATNLARKINASVPRTKAHLDELVAAGMVLKTGKQRGTRYSLVVKAEAAE